MKECKRIKKISIDIGGTRLLRRTAKGRPKGEEFKNGAKKNGAKKNGAKKNEAEKNNSNLSASRRT